MPAPSVHSGQALCTWGFMLYTQSWRTIRAADDCGAISERWRTLPFRIEEDAHARAADGATCANMREGSLGRVACRLPYVPLPL